MNAKNRAKMATDQEFIEKVFDIRYGLTTDKMIR